MTSDKSESVILSQKTWDEGRIILSDHCGPLMTSKTEKIGSLKYKSTLKNSPERSRFYCTSHYRNKHRLKPNWICSPLLVIEFDDRTENFKRRETVDEAAEFDCTRAALVMGALMGRSGSLHWPDLATYSGGKSIHSAFFLEPWIQSQSDLHSIKKSAQILAKRIKKIDPIYRTEWQRAAISYDMSVYASETAISSLPYPLADKNRLAQRCWACELGKKTSLHEILLTSQQRCAEDNEEKERAKKIQTNAQFMPSINNRGVDWFSDQNFTASELESALGELIRASEPEKFVCLCPIHDDSHPSAFVSAKSGFFLQQMLRKWSLLDRSCSSTEVWEPGGDSKWNLKTSIRLILPRVQTQPVILGSKSET